MFVCLEAARLGFWVEVFFWLGLVAFENLFHVT